MKSGRTSLSVLFGLLFIFILTLTSCYQSRFTEKLKECDSVSIVFTDENQMVIKQVETTKKAAINQLAEYIDNSIIEKNQCHLGGRIIFFQSGIAIEQVEFNTSGNCRYFTRISEGKLISTKMSEEAASFLESIKEGKDYY